MRAYAIVTVDDPEPQPLDFDQDHSSDHWKANEAKAGSMMRVSCSTIIWRIVLGMRNPHEMWNTPETILDTARF